MTDQHLQAVVRAWKDYLQYTGLTAETFIAPTGLELATFLDAAAGRGPTVAPTRLRAFRWLREHVGGYHSQWGPP